MIVRFWKGTGEWGNKLEVHFAPIFTDCTVARSFEELYLRILHENQLHSDCFLCEGSSPVFGPRWVYRWYDTPATLNKKKLFSLIEQTTPSTQWWGTSWSTSLHWTWMTFLSIVFCYTAPASRYLFSHWSYYFVGTNVWYFAESAKFCTCTVEHYNLATLYHFCVQVAKFSAAKSCLSQNHRNM
jgi:hypothetical protein